MAKIAAAESTAVQLESNICGALSVQTPVARDVGGYNETGQHRCVVQRVEKFELDSAIQ